MRIEDVLALYDREERRQTEEPGLRRELAPGVVRLVDEIGRESTVIYSELDAGTADAAIRREAAYFAGLGHDLEWKLYTHDTPRDLHERLVARGFRPDEPEAIMALDLEEVPEALLGPVPDFIRRLEDPARLEDVTRVREAVWPGEHQGLEERLARLMRTRPSYLSVYVAYADGLPVCEGRINFPEKSMFASIWGGATLSAYRRQGYYTAVLAVRVQEARQRGARFLTIDASPMSRPIVEKFGFRLLTMSQPHVRTAGA